MSVIRTSLGIAYNVLISGMSYTVDTAYKNTFGSSKLCSGYMATVPVQLLLLYRASTIPNNRFTAVGSYNDNFSLINWGMPKTF